ncbi:MAG: four helix bundle protein [Chitinophagaceae bacterium]
MLDLSHKKLDVYIISLNLVKETYNITNQFPLEEKYTLTSQLKRAAISVSSNIAEGAARISKQEKKRFFEIARSSVVEIDTQIEIALLLEYVHKKDLEQLYTFIESVFKILSKLISNLNTN